MYDGSTSLHPISSRGLAVGRGGRAVLAEALEPRLLLSTYYVDADAPSGGNGSSGSPWNSIAQVNAAVLQPGDSVLFQRGDTFRATLSMDESGTSGNPITFGAYGTGAAPRILGSERVTGWTAHATNVWKAFVSSSPATPNMVTSDDTGLFKESTLANLGAGEWHYDSTAQMLYVYDSAGNPDTTGKKIEAAVRTRAVSSNGKDWIVVENLEIGRTRGTAILVNQDAADWIIRDNLVRFCNSDGAEPTAGIQLSAGLRGQVLNNTLHFMVGDAIYVQSAKDVLVEGNTVTGMYTFGSIYTGDAVQVTGSAPDRFRVANNYIDMRDSDSGKGGIMTEYGVDGYIGGNTVLGGQFGIEVNGSNTVVENNIVANTLNNGAIRSANDNNADGIIIRGNLLYDNQRAIFLTNDKAVNGKVRTNLQVYNNTIVSSGSVGLSTSYITATGSFKNNIVSATTLYDVAVQEGGVWFSDNNILDSTTSRKVLKQSHGESFSFYIKPGSVITARGISTGVTATTGAQYFLMRIDHGSTSDTANVWVNPDLSGGQAGLGTPQVVTSYDEFDISAFQMNFSSTAYNSGGADEIRMGDTFNEAVGIDASDVEEAFNYSSGAYLHGLSGGTGWGGSWASELDYSTVLSPGWTRTGLSAEGNRARFRGDIKRDLASPIAKSSGSTWIGFYAQSDNSSRSTTVSLREYASWYSSFAEAYAAAGLDGNSMQTDPLYVDRTGDDYHLQEDSPAIDAGAAVTRTVDLEGNPVPTGAGIDIGAYEAQPVDVVYVNESFDYSTGTLSGANGGSGFGGAWVTGGTSLVSSGSLTASGYYSTGNKAQLYGTSSLSMATAERSFSNAYGNEDGTLWLSFLGQKSSSYREAKLILDNLTFRINGSGTWQAITGGQTVTTDVSYGQVGLFVARITFNGTSDTLDLWTNPDTSLTDPGTPEYTITGVDIAFDSIKLSVGPYGNSAQAGYFDEFRLGSTYEAVLDNPAGAMAMMSSSATLTLQSDPQGAAETLSASPAVASEPVADATPTAASGLTGSAPTASGGDTTLTAPTTGKTTGVKSGGRKQSLLKPLGEDEVDVLALAV